MPIRAVAIGVGIEPADPEPAHQPVSTPAPPVAFGYVQAGQFGGAVGYGYATSSPPQPQTMMTTGEMRQTSLVPYPTVGPMMAGKDSVWRSRIDRLAVVLACTATGIDYGTERQCPRCHRLFVADPRVYGPDVHIPCWACAPHQDLEIGQTRYDGIWYALCVNGLDPETRDVPANPERRRQLADTCVFRGLTFGWRAAQPTAITNPPTTVLPESWRPFTTKYVDIRLSLSRAIVRIPMDRLGSFSGATVLATNLEPDAVRNYQDPDTPGMTWQVLCPAPQVPTRS